MTIAVKPESLDRFMALSDLHEVESTVIGKYTDSGKLHIKYKDQTCAYVDMDLLDKGFPAWEFDAVWTPPAARGLTEPVISTPTDFNGLLEQMLARPNICGKEWIIRQYDHEVQGRISHQAACGDQPEYPDRCFGYQACAHQRARTCLFPEYSALVLEN